VKYSIPLDFYFVMDGTEFKNDQQYDMLPSHNILCSAYGIMKRGPGSLGRCRSAYDKLIIDSGCISAWKKQDVDWLDPETQNKYVAATKKLKPTIICHLDLTMEPQFLKMNQITSEKALKKTVDNAEHFLELDTGDAEKMFGLQGWNLQEYATCIREYRKLGLFKDEYIIGVGTTCMRSPPILYQVYEYIIPLIKKINPNQRIHAFGIAKPEWLYELHRLGITSGDSATPLVKMIKREIYPHIKLRVNPLPKDGSRALYIFNAWMWYMKLWGKFNENITQKRLYDGFI